jgi:predicted DNA binding CopG/RHH family protein
MCAQKTHIPESKSYNRSAEKNRLLIEARLKAHKTAANATFKKDQRLNIRISSRDLKNLQARALEEGIPYQTLAASLVHKYVSGQLVERR